MKLIPFYCETCPDWYDFPPEGEPDVIYGYGGSKPPEDVSLADVRIALHRGHDYRVSGNRFRYAYSGGDRMWLLFQYGQPEPHVCPVCEHTSPPRARFCIMCGVPTGSPRRSGE